MDASQGFDALTERNRSEDPPLDIAIDSGSVYGGPIESRKDGAVRLVPSGSVVANRYKVLRPLGGGGMKRVYLAEDLHLAGRLCVLAEMIDSFPDDASRHTAIKSFQGEATMLAALDENHIPEVFDNFSEQNRHYLAREYVDGETLDQKLSASGGRLPEGEVISIASEVLKALEYLHNLSPPVVFRDLKASNVMLNGRGEVKLIDFGIARYFQPAKAATVIGTQGYAPPEQYKGKAEPRSDLYALGALMHYLLSGRDPSSEPPFSFPSLGQLVPGCSLRLAELVHDALAYDLEKRVPTAAEFRRRLSEVQKSPFAAKATTKLVQADTQKSPHDFAAGRRARWTGAFVLLGLLFVGYQVAAHLLETSQDFSSHTKRPPAWETLSTAPERGVSVTRAAINSVGPPSVPPVIDTKSSPSVTRQSSVTVPGQAFAAIRPVPSDSSSSNVERTDSAKPKISLPSKRYFTIGSHQDRVLAVQGTPTSVMNWGFDETWRYDNSSVDFGADGTVKGYSNISHNLRVRVAPPVKTTGRFYFTIGSDKTEVLAAQGTPTSVMNFRYKETWRYHYSSVDFGVDGTVNGYSNISHNLRIRTAAN